MAEVRIHEPAYAADVEGTKRFKVIVFDADNRILVVRTNKLIDLPGGRVEWEDDTLGAAVRREVLETTGVTLGLLAVAAVMVASSPAGQDDPQPILVMSGRAMGIATPGGTLRRQRYPFIDKEKLLQRYKAGNPDALRKLIEMAEFALADEREQPRHKKRAS
jgi:ADP-ribose pyrophosphatase YjhB (NUDIX family)